MDDPLIASLTTAVEAAPADVPLRLHLARLLLDAGRADDAMTHAAAALTHQPDSAEARALLTEAAGRRRLRPPRPPRTRRQRRDRPGSTGPRPRTRWVARCRRCSWTAARTTRNSRRPTTWSAPASRSRTWAGWRR
ncbi:MAG: tetratricopeptide repeat protein [Nocardioides sp.]